MENFKVRTCPSYNGDTFGAIINNNKDKLDTWIREKGCWHSPIKGCFKIPLWDFNQSAYKYSRTIHFRIESKNKFTPTIIWIW